MSDAKVSLHGRIRGAVGTQGGVVEVIYDGPVKTVPKGWGIMSGEKCSMAREMAQERVVRRGAECLA